MIVLVRHGQTAANAGARLQGRSDLPLSPLGARQAEVVAGVLADSGIDRVVSSPLPRAWQTAGAIAAALGCEVEPEPDLVELDYGQWEGRALADVDPADWHRWRTDPSFSPPGGEALAAVRARVESWLDRQRGGEPLIAVSHVSPIKAAVCSALGVTDDITWRMHLDVASISRLTRRNDIYLLASFNETPASGLGNETPASGLGVPH